jgi:hypothetical protein
MRQALRLVWGPIHPTQAAFPVQGYILSTDLRCSDRYLRSLLDVLKGIVIHDSRSLTKTNNLLNTYGWHKMAPRPHCHYARGCVNQAIICSLCLS